MRWIPSEELTDDILHRDLFHAEVLDWIGVEERLYGRDDTIPRNLELVF